MPVRPVLFQGLSEGRLEETQANLQVSHVGNGAMQRTDLHIERSMKLKEEFEEGERSLTRDEAILQTIQDSTLEGSPAAARDENCKRQTKHNQRIMLFHSFTFLFADSNAFVAKQSTSHAPVRRSQRAVGDQETRFTPLHDLADLADPLTTQPMKTSSF
jgi:hypothetical protein